jgi:hypothetical protein
LVRRQNRKSVLKSGEAKIRLSLRAVDPVKEGRELNELAAGVHEVQVENLLASHRREKAEDELKEGATSPS